MASWHPKHCKECGRHERDAGTISKAGKCNDCAVRNLAAMALAAGQVKVNARQRRVERAEEELARLPALDDSP